MSAGRRAAGGPAALRGAAARGAPTPSPQCPAESRPSAARRAPAARAWPAARRQQEAGDLRAQPAPSAAGGRRERYAGAGLLRPARAPPLEGQSQTVQSWALDSNPFLDRPAELSGGLRGPSHWDLQNSLNLALSSAASPVASFNITKWN